jgi:predicted dehydrogenase
MTNKLKVGIVGASCRQSFARSFQAIEETDVTAICDLNINTAERVANQFNIDQKFRQRISNLAVLRIPIFPS